MSRRKSKTLAISVIALSFLSFLPGCSALTWDSNVVVGNWMKYEISLYISAYGIIKLSYSSDVTLRITSVQPTGLNFTVTDMQGNLNGFLENFVGLDVGHSDFILPSNMIILPLESLANSSISFGNVTIDFVVMKEADYTKYWRGIEIRKADLSSISSLIPLGNSSFLVGVISVMFNINDAYIKYDNTSGFLYQLHFGMTIDLSMFGITTTADGYFDVSMVDASPTIAADIDARRDHSMDAYFALQKFFETSWVAVIILVVSVIVVFGIIKVYQSRRKVPTKRITTSTGDGKKKVPSKTRDDGAERKIRRTSGKHAASESARKYRTTKT